MENYKCPKCGSETNPDMIHLKAVKNAKDFMEGLPDKIELTIEEKYVCNKEGCGTSVCRAYDVSYLRPEE